MSNDDRESLPTGSTRRKFLLTSGTSVAASLVAAYVPASAKSVAEMTDSVPITGTNIEGAVPITLRINGKDHKLNIDPRTTLLDCIRETVTLTGTKKGCDHGQCGACTVHVN